MPVDHDVGYDYNGCVVKHKTHSLFPRWSKLYLSIHKLKLNKKFNSRHMYTQENHPNCCSSEEKGNTRDEIFTTTVYSIRGYPHSCSWGSPDLQVWAFLMPLRMTAASLTLQTMTRPRLRVRSDCPSGQCERELPDC